MAKKRALPRVVLMCHEGDPVDTQGLAAWLANSFDLVGIIKLREPRRRLLTKLNREKRRIGIFRVLDVLAFRLFYRLRLAQRDAAWTRRALAALRNRYPANLADITTLTVADPNTRTVGNFISGLNTDFLIARCKYILKPDIFNKPAHGTYILHPGICPEYRNAHGCFWALANRDLARVGMTLLRADSGVDTGPILLQTGCDFDELRESHIVVQHRVVLDNLETIADKLLAAWRGEASTLPVAERKSATWGQPWLTAYLKWKYQARKAVR